MTLLVKPSFRLTLSFVAETLLVLPVTSLRSKANALKKLCLVKL